MIRTFLLPFAAGVAGTLVLTPPVRRVALRMGVVARPSADRWHEVPVPLLGGVAIAVSALVATTVAGGLEPRMIIAFGAGIVMAAVGVVDDVHRLKPSTKLAAQIAVACGVVIAGIDVGWTGSRAVDSLLTIGWFVGITNAFNLLDNMDGLCAGVAAIAGLAFCASTLHDPRLVIAGAAIAGASGAFLVFNFKPASIFMGDAGSLFLGSTLSALPILAGAKGPRSILSTVVVPVLLLLIPIFDTTLVTVSRKLSARSASQGGKDHSSHRLVALGFSERQAVLVLYTLAAVAGFVAVGLRQSNIREILLLLFLVLLGLALLAVQLARVGVYDGRDFTSLRDTPLGRAMVEMAYKRRVVEVVLDFGLITLAYYASYVLRFDRDFALYTDLFSASLPIVIATQLISFFVAGVYRGVWRYFGPADLAVYLRAVALAVASTVIVVVYVYRFESFSRSVFIIDAMALALLLVGSRASFRFIGELAGRSRRAERRALIYGAGDGGALLVRELRNNPKYRCQPAAFLDDDLCRHGRKILGLYVIGGIEQLERAALGGEFDVLIISTEKLHPDRLAEVERVCRKVGIELLRLDFKLEPLLGGGTP